MLSTRTLQSGLLMAEIDYLDEEEELDIPDQFFYMQELLMHISNQKQEQLPPAEFCSIVYQLIYLLPLDYTLKQQLLEVPHCMDRAVVLQRLRRWNDAGSLLKSARASIPDRRAAAQLVLAALKADQFDLRP